MKFIVLFVMLLISGTVFAWSEQSFTVLEVGASNNTNSIFLVVAQPANNTTCTNPNLFRMPLTDQLANKFYAAALSAQAQKKMMTLGYNSTDCLTEGVVPRSFKVVN